MTTPQPLSACCKAPINLTWLPQGYQLSVLQGITHIGEYSCARCHKKLWQDGTVIPDLNAGYIEQGSSNGKTADSKTANVGSIPTPCATAPASSASEWIKQHTNNYPGYANRPEPSQVEQAILDYLDEFYPPHS